MERTLQVLNQIERDGVLGRYAIGVMHEAIFQTDRSLKQS